MSEELETQFGAAIAAGKIHGAVICATDAAGRFVYNNALGYRVLLSGEERPQQLDDVLCLASATSLITTIAALQCVERGLVTLDGGLSLIAPELEAQKAIMGYSGEKPTLQPPVVEITLEMLLTHLSGYVYHFLDQYVSRWYTASASHKKNNCQRVEQAFNYPLGFQPGGGWQYGPGLGWAGRVVERITDSTLDDYVHEHILRPLGIIKAQFYPVTRDDLRDHLVDLNPQDPQCLGKAVLGGDGALNKYTKGAFGGHGLSMAGVDFVKVLRSLLANDGMLLKPSTVDSMFLEYLRPCAELSLQKVLSGELGTFFRADHAVEIGTSHGLGGLLTLEDIAGGYGKSTLTWAGSLTIAWFVDRKHDLCGIGAIQPSLPIRGSGTILGLKETLYRDIYAKHREWKR